MIEFIKFRLEIIQFKKKTEKITYREIVVVVVGP